METKIDASKLVDLGNDYIDRFGSTVLAVYDLTSLERALKDAASQGFGSIQFWDLHKFRNGANMLKMYFEKKLKHDRNRIRVYKESKHIVGVEWRKGWDTQVKMPQKAMLGIFDGLLAAKAGTTATGERAAHEGH